MVFGSKKDNKENVDAVPAAEVPADDASVGSTDSKGMKKSWFGGEKKKPRAEYQAEIDELKLQLAASNSELEETRAKLQSWQLWMRKAPRN